MKSLRLLFRRGVFCTLVGMNEHSVTIWLKQLAEDEFNAAADALWKRLWPRLRGRALKTLQRFPRVQRVADPDGVANEAYHEFIKGIQSGATDVHDRGSAWALLATIVDRRASNEIRAEMAAKRGRGGVRGDSVVRSPEDSGQQGFDGIADATSETPEVNDLLDLLPENEQLVMTLWLASYQDREIADQLDCSVATVRRRRKRSLELLRKELDEQQ